MNTTFPMPVSSFTAREHLAVRYAQAGLPLDTSFYERRTGEEPSGLRYFTYELAFPRHSSNAETVRFFGTFCKTATKALERAVEIGARGVTLIDATQWL